MERERRSAALSGMDNEDVIRGIRDRMARCRRLAAQINDDYARRELLKMAEEGEEAVRRLQADRSTQ